LAGVREFIHSATVIAIAAQVGGPPACVVPYAALEAVEHFLLPLGGGGDGQRQDNGR
jgi:hypothetical protein